MKKELQTLAIVLMALIFSSDCIAQKVKYKKGEVFIDGELTWVISENERASKQEIRTYKMVDAAGEVVFTLNDFIEYYEQLPHEQQPRVAYEAHILEAPQLNKSVAVPRINLLNFPNRINYLLKKTDLYSTKTFSEDVFNDFADKLKAHVAEREKAEYEVLKAERAEINKKSIELFGPLRERESGLMVLTPPKVYEGGKIIFKYKKYVSTTKTPSDRLRTYDLFDNAGDHIGWIVLNEKSATHSVSLGAVDVKRLEEDPDNPSMLDGQYMIIDIPKLKDLTDLSIEGKMERIAKYLFDIGAL